MVAGSLCRARRGTAWRRLFSSVWVRPARHPPHVLPCIYVRAAACPSRSCSHPFQLAKMALTAALQSQANAILASDEAANDKVGKLNGLWLQHGLAAYQTQVPEKFLVHPLIRGGAMLNGHGVLAKAHHTRLAARPEGNLCGGFIAWHGLLTSCRGTACMVFLFLLFLLLLSIAWHGMAWFGYFLSWHGIACFGMAWHGWCLFVYWQLATCALHGKMFYFTTLLHAICCTTLFEHVVGLTL